MPLKVCPFAKLPLRLIHFLSWCLHLQDISETNRALCEVCITKTCTQNSDSNVNNILSSMGDQLVDPFVKCLKNNTRVKSKN